MVDPVGTPLAALATAEQCVKLAAVLREKYRDYRNAERDLGELILTLEYHAATIEHQVAVLRSVWHSLEGRLQNLQNTLLHVLYHKLQYAVELVDAAIGSKQDRASLRDVLGKRGPMRRLYFAFSLKQCLQKTVDDLRKWHQMFDPTWYLISRISSHAVDVSLRTDHRVEAKSVSVLRHLRNAINRNQKQHASGTRLLDVTSLHNETITSFVGYDIRQARLVSGEKLIVNQFVPHERASHVKVGEEIEKLASTLGGIDPEVFGLLQCHGFVQSSVPVTPQPQPSQQVFKLLFLVPPNLSHPVPLRAMMVEDQLVPLNVRLRLAQAISNAVMFVHSSQFVHKNIRPETIICFTSRTSVAPVPFLLRLEKFRTAEGETFKISDSEWEKDVYRHPQRQGFWPEEEYNMLHDVYSLGVVLLEIGLWTNFVIYDSDNNACVGPALPVLAADLRKDVRRRALLIKDSFAKAAREQLPSRMGARYAEIVVSCLTCLDIVNPGLGDRKEFLDEDDVVVGVEFVESVIMRLHEIAF